MALCGARNRRHDAASASQNTASTTQSEDTGPGPLGTLLRRLPPVLNADDVPGCSTTPVAPAFVRHACVGGKQAIRVLYSASSSRRNAHRQAWATGAKRTPIVVPLGQLGLRASHTVLPMHVGMAHQQQPHRVDTAAAAVCVYCTHSALEYCTPSACPSVCVQAVASLHGTLPAKLLSVCTNVPLVPDPARAA